MGRFCKKKDKLHGVEVPLDEERPEETDDKQDIEDEFSEEPQEEEPQA